MKIKVIIPARLKSTRLSNKLLRVISGKTIIQHVCERATRIQCDDLIVASDSRKITDIVNQMQINTYLSKKKFNNGTERIAHLCNEKNFKDSDVIINLQADELNFPIHAINKIINLFNLNNKINVATVVTKNTNKKDYFNKDIVKVVMDNDSNSIYFSREPIPHNYSKYFYSHIGIYAYKVSALHSYTKFKQSLQEKCESLEQLRFLCNGISIKCVLIKQNKSISINSNNDLKLARKLF